MLFDKALGFPFGVRRIRMFDVEAPAFSRDLRVNAKVGRLHQQKKSRETNREKNLW